MDVLEYNDVCAEIKGANCAGRLKLTEQHIVFKNSKTGKVEQIPVTDLDLCNWQKLVGSWGLRLFLKNGSLKRFFGFKESEIEKIGKYFKSKYSYDLSEKELSVKGWNWGTAKFNGSALSFDIGSLSAFEIPLNDVSQCTTGKNEVTVEFHQNDEAPVSLMEMRFHIPMSELAGDDPVDAFHKQVMMKASVITVNTDAIAIFREIQCLTPRGRYDIKVFQSFFQLHGKTFDYKIPMQTVLRLFVLPHKDGRQNFFVVSLDPPIKQGQTRYHYLVFLFGQDEDTSCELPFTEEELQEKYEGKLTKEMTGPTYDVISRIMKALVNRKITVPGNFTGHSGTPAVGCSYKAAAGYLYPLERGFIYIHKPPLHIRFEEITSVNFARSGGSTRSFDFEVELKSGVIHTFSSIEKEEYGKLFDFISSKKLHVKNTGKSGKQNYGGSDDFGNSDEEGEPDAYLARVKREAKEREEDDEGGSSDDDSTDEDFKPTGEVSDVAEEYDSNPTPTDSDADSDASGGGEGGSGEEKKKKKKKEKKKKTVTVSEGGTKKRRKKKEKDENKPKRAPSAYMLWFNENREQIKKDNPGISFTDIAKKGGELWKNLSDKSEWESKATKLKEEYKEALSEYKASGGGAGGGGGKGAKRKEGGGGGGGGAKKRKSSGAGAGEGSPTKSSYISKEFIEDSDSSSSDDGKKKASTNGGPGVVAPKKEEKTSNSEKGTQEKKPVKKEKSDSDDDKSSDDDDDKAAKAKKSEDKKIKKEEDDEDEEEILSTPTASSDSEGSDDEDKKSKKKKSGAKDTGKAKKGGEKKKKKDSDEDDEEEILSTPTASSSSGGSDEDD